MLFFITITFSIILILIFVIEPRIFVVVFQKIVFSGTNGGATFVDKAQHFPESALLEKNWKIIRYEFQKEINGLTLPKFHQIDKLNHKISFEAGPAWRTVILKAYDGWFESNCDLFPLTYGFLGSMKNVSTIMFSVLEPGTLIPPHRGKLHGVFRYHLALQVPKSSDCFLMINNEKYNWREGEGGIV